MISDDLRSDMPQSVQDMAKNKLLNSTDFDFRLLMPPRNNPLAWDNCLYVITHLSDAQLSGIFKELLWLVEDPADYGAEEVFNRLMRYNGADKLEKIETEYSATVLCEESMAGEIMLRLKYGVPYDAPPDGVYKKEIIRITSQIYRDFK